MGLHAHRHKQKNEYPLLSRQEERRMYQQNKDKGIGERGSKVL